MKILAFETSTDACSVALRVGEETRERFEKAPRRHAELVLPMAESLLAEAGLGPGDLDGLAFGRGPGSFTGVRIAAAVVQGVAFATGLPVAPVSTLQALAEGVAREMGEDSVLAVLDARMGEVYWGAYRRAASGRMEAVVEDTLSAPERVSVPGAEPWAGAGDGWAVYGEVLRAVLGGRLSCELPARLPRAGDVAHIGTGILGRGEGVPAAAALPLYLRDRVVHV